MIHLNLYLPGSILLFHSFKGLTLWNSGPQHPDPKSRRPGASIIVENFVDQAPEHAHQRSLTVMTVMSNGKVHRKKGIVGIVVWYTLYMFHVSILARYRPYSLVNPNQRNICDHFILNILVVLLYLNQIVKVHLFQGHLHDHHSS